MKRLWQLLLGALVVLVLLVALLLGVGSVIIGKWLTPDYLEAELEKQLACDAEIGSVEYHLLRPGRPAEVVLRDITIAPGKGAAQRLLAEDVTLTDEQLAQVETLATQPVVLVERAELQLDRGALLHRRIDVGRMVFTRPTLRVVDINGLGSTLQALVRPKPVRQGPVPPQPAPKPKDEPERPTLVNLRNLEIVGGQLEFSQFDPDPRVKPGKEPEVPLQFALLDLNFRVQDIALGGEGAMEVPFLLSGKLTIDQGDALRWLSLDLDGGGRIHFPDANKRQLEGSTWNIGFAIGAESFFWGGELIADLRQELAGLARFGLISNDWEVSERGVFGPGQRFELEGRGTTATLAKPLRVDFDEAWLRIDEGGTLQLEGEMEHRLTGRLRPPAELADGAYEKFPAALDALGGLAEGSWEKIRAAYFVGEELQLPLVSDGPIGDAEVRVEPEPLDLVEGVKDLVDTGRSLIDALLGRSDDEDKPEATEEERARRHQEELERRRAERREQRRREREQQREQQGGGSGGPGATVPPVGSAPRSAAGSGGESASGSQPAPAPNDAETAREAALESAAREE